jgi:chromosomal replication initiation ATPase DnaA
VAVAEPQTIATVCRECGAPSVAFVLRLRQPASITRDNPGGVEFREARLGGELCERCSDIAERTRAQESAWADRMKFLEGSALPRAFAETDWRGFTQPEAVRLAWRWSAGRLQGLCLTGDVGVGKTRLAAAAHWSMSDRRRVRWVDTAQLVTSLRAGFDDKDRARAMRVINGSGAAIFDDLDKVNPSEYVQEVLFAALNARIAAGSPLLITTNEPISRLGELLGRSIMSRLAGYCAVVEMLGPDRRVQRPELRAA